MIKLPQFDWLCLYSVFPIHWPPLALSHSYHCSLVVSPWYLEGFNTFCYSYLCSRLLIHPGCHCQIQISLDCFHSVISLSNGPKLLAIIIIYINWVLLCAKMCAKNFPRITPPNPTFLFRRGSMSHFTEFWHL